MKKIFFAAALATLIVAGPSCKSKNKTPETMPTTVPPTEQAPAPTAPVQISADDELRKGVTDATKDVKGLTARVDSGVIYLSGTISKADNMRITPTLSSLRPKRIDRQNLTVK